LKKLAFLGTAALLGGLVFGLGTTPAMATTVTFTEGTNGIVQAVNGATVASDGEVSFRPFGVTFDTTDGIILPALATPWTKSALSTGWTNVGGNTWVLPAVNENEPTSESVGIWTNPTPLAAANLGLVTLNQSNGITLSDLINFTNTASGAMITFSSDPTLIAIVPVPAALPLFATGLGALGLFGWRRKRKAAA